jgi:Xaa-Pro dipeptidase
MVFTIEPGLYIPKIGGVRYEDVVVMTEDGYKLL